MRKLITSLLLLIALGTTAQEKQNYLKFHLGYDLIIGKPMLSPMKPGISYERLFGEKNSINVGAFGAFQFFEALSENSAGKDYYHKLSGGGAFISYRRYLSKYKPAPTGLFVEPGVDITYFGATTRTGTGVGIEKVSYKSNYLTTTPFVGFGFNMQTSKNMVYGFKLNLGYLIPVGLTKEEVQEPANYPQSNGEATYTTPLGATVTYATYPDVPVYTPPPPPTQIPGGKQKAINSGVYIGIGIQIGFGL